MIKNNGKRILLDQVGECFSSDEFSGILSNWKNNGFNKINFIIGGADGVDQKLKDNVDLIISFSKMTFPHMLARVILLEQIYRAEAIIAKHPYHRN